MLQPIYFYTELIYAIYNTFEKIQALADINTPASTEEQIIIPITENIAWIKYLKDLGFNDNKIEDYSTKVQRMILREEDKDKAPPCILSEEVKILLRRLEMEKKIKKKI